MKNKIYVMALVVGLAAASSHRAIAEEHSHNEKNTEQMSLNHGIKWSIDDSLHLGMSHIRDEVMTNLNAIHYNNFSDKQFAEMVPVLEKHLTYLFENCKLPTQADAQLHTLLAKIMKGIDKMKNTADKKQGTILIVQALKDYPIYFNDPNWQVVEH